MAPDLGCARRSPVRRFEPPAARVASSRFNVMEIVKEAQRLSASGRSIYSS